MYERIIVITKETTLQELLLRHNSASQLAFFLKSRGSSIAPYEREDALYQTALKTVLEGLPWGTPYEIIPRKFIASFLFREKDLVIVIGPDGLCANVAKYLNGQLMIAVNPDPAHIAGILMRVKAEMVGKLIDLCQKDECAADQLVLACAKTNDGQEIYAVNDFQIGRRDQASARYEISFRGERESQSTSGVLVCTGVGSTGWMTSLLTGVGRIALEVIGNEGDEAIKEKFSRLTRGDLVPYPWDAPYLLFAVREPFPSRTLGASIVLGRIQEGEELVITSQMGEGGAIFSDGVLEDALEFNAGASAKIGVAGKRTWLVRPVGEGR